MPVTFLKTFEDQDIFIKNVFEAKHKFYLLAGDIRSGKSITTQLILVLLAKIFAKSRWCIIRKDIPTIKRNTLPTFFKYACPSRFIVDYNRSDLIVTFYNGSQIFFMSENFSEDTEGQRFLGLEVNGCLFEQMEECQRETFNIMMSRTGQWKIDPMPPQLILANCNPTDGWPKEVFYDPFKEGKLSSDFYFQECDIRKNPYIDKGYIEMLQRNWPSQLVKRFLERRWESSDEAWQLVPWECIYKSKELIGKRTPGRWLGVDVGRQGADPSIWLMIDDCNVKILRRIAKTDIDEVYDVTKQVMAENKIQAEDVCIDCVGLGAGVGDFLVNKDGLAIIRFFEGEKCNQFLQGSNFKFSNMRSWISWLAADEIKSGNIGGYADPALISQTGAIRYGINRDREIYIQSKDEFKEKMHRSCDEWDAFRYAIWAKIRMTVMPCPGAFTL